MAARRVLLRAAAICLVPPAAKLDPAAWDEFFEIVRDALLERSFSVRMQFQLFLTFLNIAAWLGYGWNFTRLDPPNQETLLRWLEDNPLLILRQGFWGLKTLVLMGYYGRPALWGRLAYTPVLEGNRMLHD